MRQKTTTEADIGAEKAADIMAARLLGMAIGAMSDGAGMSRESAGLLLLSRLAADYQCVAPREMGALLRAMAAIGQLHATGASAAVAEGHYARAHQAVLDACDLADAKPKGSA